MIPHRFLFIITLLFISSPSFAGASNEWITSNHNDGCGSNTFFINNMTGWFYDYKMDFICRTDDSGLTFQKQHVGLEISSIFFLNGITGWAAGKIAEYNEHLSQVEKVWGQIKVTTDGGKTWKTQYDEFMGTHLSAGIHDIYFVSFSVGWALGSKGLIVHTKDSGKHWVHQVSGTNLILREAHFSSERVGVVLGGNRGEVDQNSSKDRKTEGIILFTEDGGNQWHKVWSRRPVSIGCLHFIDANRGFATVEMLDHSLLLITQDGGKSWSETKINYSGLGRPLFMDRNNGLITMDGNMVIITRDGGQTWIKQSVPTGVNIWHFSKIFEGKRY